MMSKKKKLIAAIAVFLLVGLILNAIFTWGIIFEHDGGFEWSITDIFEDILTENQPGEIRLGEKPSKLIFCVPLVFWVYSIEPPPYVILLNIDDETESIERIFIELISIEYVDGQKMDHNINWERKFKRSSIHVRRNSKNVDIPVMQLTDKLPVTVDRRQSCRIRFVGHFVNKGGEKITFDTAEYFEYEPHRWRIYPAAGSF